MIRAPKTTPINQFHVDFIHEVDQKVIWATDRLRLDHPFLTIHRTTRTDSIPHAAHEGTVTEDTLGPFPCTFMDYTEHKIMNSGGLIQSTDQLVVIYDFDPEDTDIIQMEVNSGNYWSIQRKTYHKPSGRCELQLRPQKTGVG